MRALFCDRRTSLQGYVAVNTSNQAGSFCTEKSSNNYFFVFNCILLKIILLNTISSFFAIHIHLFGKKYVKLKLKKVNVRNNFFKITRLHHAVYLPRV
jgi:type III secretory pathway component EscU